MNTLDGISVVSLAQNLPGPLAVARLRRMGATVLKVEPPSGDMLGIYQPGWYQELHDGVEVVTLDLHTPDGAAALRKHLAQSDLLVTSSRPSALKRLGLSWPLLGATFPRLAQVAIVGYDSDPERAGHDLNYQARSGLLAEAMPRALVADVGGALLAVAAALELVIRIQRRGPLASADRFIQVALASAAEEFAVPARHGLTATDGLLGGLLPQYNLYHAQDGVVALAALEGRFLHTLTEALGVAEPEQRAFAEAFATRTCDDWEAWGNEHDVPICAVRSAG